jgi:hypothetical protein
MTSRLDRYVKSLKRLRRRNKVCWNSVGEETGLYAEVQPDGSLVIEQSALSLEQPGSSGVVINKNQLKSLADWLSDLTKGDSRD